MIPTERIRRDEDVSVGFTSIGVTVVEIRRVEVQGPIGDFLPANRPLEEKLNAPFSEIRFPERKARSGPKKRKSTLLA